jgi:hypothetical protein
MKPRQKKSGEEEVPDIKEECKNCFNELLTFAESNENNDFGKFERGLFKYLLNLGVLLTQLYFSKKKGDFGKEINTLQGKAIRGPRMFTRTITCIFGKVEVERYFYYVNETGFGALDIYLNLPKHTYSYFLSEFCNMLSINRSYNETSSFIMKFFSQMLSVSAIETITAESSTEYDNFNKHIRETLDLSACNGTADNHEGNTEQEEIKDIELPTKELQDGTLLKVVSFDGVGVPMIKKEAAKIKARNGRGEKQQKKKEALIGVEYEVEKKERTAEEIAQRMIFPEKEKKDMYQEKEKDSHPQNKKYVASIEKSKREVMSMFYERIKNDDFTIVPLICLIDGAKSLINAFKDEFKKTSDKVMILDIIHVIEYIWIMAHLKYKEGSKETRNYVYEKLLMVLKGEVCVYIKELEEEIEHNKLKKSQKKIYQKVITYLKNHQMYMCYNEYLSKGYPIGTGVIESACSHVVKQRTEITGARWGINGAETILKLRSVKQSNEWEGYWEFYTSKRKDSAIVDIDTIRQYKLAA